MEAICWRTTFFFVVWIMIITIDINCSCITVKETVRDTINVLFHKLHSTCRWGRCPLSVGSGKASNRSHAELIGTCFVLSNQVMIVSFSSLILSIFKRRQNWAAYARAI